MTFGMGGLARGCEFALDDSRGEVFKKSEHIQPTDVSFFKEGGVGAENSKVRMRKKKDLKLLTGKHDVVVFAGGGRYFDAVRSLREWLEVRRSQGLAEDGPLFCWPDGTPLCVSEVRACVKRVAAAAGQDPNRYGAHSLRIGGATAALAAGVPPALIRMMGRWSSDVYQIYCRMSLESALNVGRALASAQVTPAQHAFTREELELMPEELTGIVGIEEDAA